MKLVVPQYQPFVLALLAQLADTRQGFAQVVIEPPGGIMPPSVGVDADLELAIADRNRSDGIDRRLQQKGCLIPQSRGEAEPAQSSVDIGEESVGEGRGFGVRLRELPIDDYPAGGLGLALHAVEEDRLANSAQPCDDHVARSARIAHECADRFDLLLAVGQTGWIDAGAGTVRAGSLRRCQGDKG